MLDSKDSYWELLTHTQLQATIKVNSDDIVVLELL